MTVERTGGASGGALLGSGEAGRVRLRTLTLIRWGAVGGQVAAILVVHYGLGFRLPLLAALAVVGASAALNLVITSGRPGGAWLGEQAAAWFLAFDIGQLAVLLYLTGGLENPFAFLLLAPVTVSATILTLRSTIALCVFALVCITVLAAAHWPLPWSVGGFALPTTYILGSWVALALGIAFFSSYTWRVAEEAQRMSNALAATQLALAREQQLSALGGLAAAAAHELGSPLGTIAVTTHEIARDLPADSPLSDDVQLLLSETARCRDILAELARRADGDEGTPYTRLPIDTLVQAAVSRHVSDRISVRLDAGATPNDDDSPAPITTRSAEIIHGLGNLVQNAIQFARRDTRVTTRWNSDEISVTIRDDGPGFPARVIERLGEPYISGHQHDVDHMGLGIFIARTLLGRTGGEIAFANHPEGGAEVTVRWQRDALEFDMPPDAGSTSIEDLMALSPDGFQPNERMLLVVDDDEPFRKRLARAMEMRGFAVVTAESVAEGIAVAQQNPPGYAVLDLRLNDGSGLDIVTAIRHRRNDARIVMLTGYGNIVTAVAAVKAGAVDYLAKPADADTIEAALLAPEGALPPPPEHPMSADRVRWEHIQRVFEQCDRNVSETARRLNMHRRTLQRILSKHAPRETRPQDL